MRKIKPMFCVYCESDNIQVANYKNQCVYVYCHNCKESYKLFNNNMGVLNDNV